MRGSVSTSRAAVVIAAAAAASSASAATPDNVSSRLQIHVPQSLFKADGYDHREALFGVPPYGGSIAQNVYYADSDLCDPTVDTRKGYPIRAKDKDGKISKAESEGTFLANFFDRLDGDSDGFVTVEEVEASRARRKNRGGGGRGGSGDRKGRPGKKADGKSDQPERPKRPKGDKGDKGS